MILTADEIARLTGDPTTLVRVRTEGARETLDWSEADDVHLRAQVEERLVAKVSTLVRVNMDAMTAPQVRWDTEPDGRPFCVVTALVLHNPDPRITQKIQAVLDRYGLRGPHRTTVTMVVTAPPGEGDVPDAS